MGIPGHYNSTEAIGNIKLIHRGVGGKISGLLLQVHVSELVEIAVVLGTGAWPADLREGVRLWVRGSLAMEREVVHRKNVHLIVADHISVVRPWKPGQ